MEETRAIDEPLVFTRPKPDMCLTCLNANGEPPFEDSPMKSYCLAYPRAEGMRKPTSVYFDGGPCEFYRGAYERRA